jgi:hypothetical protein
MGKPVQQSAGEPFGAQDLGPLLKGQVAGHHGRATFVALAENFKQQFGAGFGQRHEAKFILFM